MKKEFLYFIFGVFFISVYEVIVTWIESIKTNPAKKILKGNAEIENLQELLNTQFNEIHGYDIDEDDDEE